MSTTRYTHRPEYKLEIMGGYDWSYDQIALSFVDHRHSELYLAQPLLFVKHKRGETAEPTIRLYKEEAQQIFDLLWKEGYRPKDGTGNSGHMQAVNAHLQDMRKLVFKEQGS